MKSRIDEGEDIIWVLDMGEEVKDKKAMSRAWAGASFKGIVV